MDADTLIYLYGVVPEDAPDPPAALTGVGGGPVRTVPAGGVRAVVGEVGAAEFAEEVLDARLRDLGWMGELGRLHEEVLCWFVDRSPVLPLKPLSLHADEARLRERVREGAGDWAERLRALGRAREFTLRVWRDGERLSSRLAEHSEEVRSLEREMEDAPPGRRFLLGKRAQETRRSELLRLGQQTARRVLDVLRPHVRGTAVLPIPAPGKEVAARRTLLLSAALLVEPAQEEALRERARELAGEWPRDEFELEVTGPWPPYHFVESDGA